VPSHFSPVKANSARPWPSIPLVVSRAPRLLETQHEHDGRFNIDNFFFKVSPRGLSNEHPCAHERHQIIFDSLSYLFLKTPFVVCIAGQQGLSDRFCESYHFGS